MPQRHHLPEKENKNVKFVMLSKAVLDSSTFIRKKCVCNPTPPPPPFWGEKKKECHQSFTSESMHTLSILRFQIENDPSSLPEAMVLLANLVKRKCAYKHRVMEMEYKYDADILSMAKISENLFHEITFTSALCAFIDAAGFFPNRISQMAMLPSTEQEANTKGSVGLHCTITIDIIIISGLNHVSRQYIFPFPMDNQSWRYKFEFYCIPVDLQHFLCAQQREFYQHSMLNRTLVPIGE